jgi:putative ABC transport system permease protein
MYKSYFKTAFRSMVRNKLHAFINITGLSVGMAVTIVIALWIVDELSYEKHFDKYPRIGRVLQNVTNNGEVQTWWTLPWPLAEELRKNYGSDFSNVVLTTGLQPHLLTTEDNKLNKTGLFAEQDFTKIFSLEMVYGSSHTLKDPSSILLSESTAKAYFGDKNPLGEIITIDRDKKLVVKVAGVYKDMPSTSEFSNLEFIASWDLLFNATDWIRSMSDPWRPNAFVVYTLLAEHASFEGASEKIRDAKLKKVNEALAKKKPALFIHPMQDWHLHSKFKNGVKEGGRIEYVWLFGVIGGFVLLMACINFMNLSTARSEKRAKEVGIRKAIGSLRSQLIYQFFSESILTAFFSLLLAIGVVYMMLPYFNTIADKNVSLQWTNTTWWLTAILFCLGIGIIAGSYPALYLSSIQSSKAIKGAYRAGRYAAIPRKILVTIQFAVSIVLIIGTVVVYLQVQHAKNRPIGYDTNGLVAIPMADELHTHFDAVKNELEANGTILAMAEAMSPTTQQWSSTSQLDWNGKDPDLSVDFGVISGSHDYGKTIGWEIVMGRDFSREYISDSTAIILNEAAVEYMGLKNPIGETIRSSNAPYTVVGVVKDIITSSPYNPVTPTLYYLSTWQENFLVARLSPTISPAEALTNIEAVYSKYNNEVPFTYEFTDESYARKFGDEERVGTLSTIFSTLAVFISCLGILGLSSFMAEQRMKEIGVRKVMGASVLDLWKLMSRDFVLLVTIASIVATPIAYITVSSWLENYRYHLAMPWWAFIAAALGTLLITLLTVSWHTINAASINPVKSLRAE